nr:DsbA family protein [Candidatus Woesearchaeota archaeon]
MESEKKKLTIEVDQLTIWRFGTVLFLVLFVISLATGGFGIGSGNSGSGDGNPTPAPNQQPSPSQGGSNANVKNLDLSNNYFKGDKNAPIVMVEFGDFQCPFCGRFYSQTLSQIDDNYIKTGKVKFYYADFPLDSIHPNARPAANAARCAGEQDKFWEYHDKVFENQEILSNDNYKKWAQELGLDEDKFNDCFDSKKYDGELNKDLQEGSANGVQGTPGFIINDKVVSGAQPFSAFQQVIEAELAS